MDVVVVGIVASVIFVGELPDKTMFAMVALSSKGRAVAVWVGAAGAFLVHVLIATTVGIVVLNALPHPVVEGLVAALFAAGAVYLLVSSDKEEEEAMAGGPASAEAVSVWRTVATAFVVILVAEWGDLTQVLTADMTARYHDPLSVAVGATASLWLVAALAVVGGKLLMRVIPKGLLRRLTAVALTVLAVIAAASAVRG